jgi:hypothetical protein
MRGHVRCYMPQLLSASLCLTILWSDRWVRSALEVQLLLESAVPALQPYYGFVVH